MKDAVGKSAKTPPKTPDLFAGAPEPRRAAGRRTSVASARGSAESGYTAKHIEVLEGLEPVRRRPGMYIGGTNFCLRASAHSCRLVTATTVCDGNALK